MSKYREITVSGTIVANPDKYEIEGESYTIRSPATGQGWGLPTKYLNPEDLRKLADRIELKRKERGVISS